MTKINWKARVQNPVWWVQIALAIFLPVLAYFGLDGKDMSTWKAFFDLLWRAFSNPYVVAMMLGSAWSAINDPTTAGVSDSMQALTYTEPKSDRGSAGPIGPAGQPGADGDAANEEDTNDSED